MSFIRLMNDKNQLSDMRNVVHPPNERQISIEGHKKCRSLDL
jgi:hypothetical protein